MCFRVRPLEMQDGTLCLSRLGTNAVNHFRNGPMDDEGFPKPKSCLEIFGRRMVAELAYAVFALTSLVEAVARIALGVISLLPCWVLSYFADPWRRDDLCALPFLIT